MIRPRSSLFRQSRRGAVTPLMMILFPAILILSAFVINLAYIQLVKTELKISTDLSARAAGRTFAQTNDANLALQRANELGQLNQVAGEPMIFAATDMQTGNSVRATAAARYQFTAAPSGNAIELTGRKGGSSPSGQIQGFLPALIGVNTVELSEASISTQTEIDIVLVFDTSGSMAYADDEVAVFPPGPKSNPAFTFGDPAPPNARWFAAVNGAATFVTELAKSPLNEHVALVTYADNATLESGLSPDYNNLVPVLNQYSNKMKGGGTNIEAGLLVAENALKSSRNFTGKAVIIMTDGKRTVGGHPDSIAKKLGDQGVLVFTITFSNEADKSLMQSVASKGNGKHFHAASGAELVDVFAEIGRQLPTLITR